MQRLCGLLVANIHPVEAVPNRTVFIHPDRVRKGKVLAQMGRIDGVGKGVMQLAARIRPKPVLVPPLGRAVALGQQKRNDGAQVVSARFPRGLAGFWTYL